MNRRTDALAGAVAALAVVVVAAVLRLVLGIPLPFEDVSDRFLPFLPVTGFLALLTATGGALASKTIAFFGSFVGVVLIGALIGRAYGKLVDGRFATRRLAVLATGVVVAWIVSVLVLFPALDANYQGRRLSPATWFSVIGLLVLIIVFALVLAFAHAALRRERPAATTRGGDRPLQRSDFLVKAGGGVFALASVGLVAELYRRSTLGYDGTLNLGERLPPITPNDRFYVVTKNFVDPRVHDDHWRFEVTGLVDHPRTYDLAELRALPAVDQELTLECISNSVGGGLLSNAVWRGVRLRDLIGSSGKHDDATWVSFGAPDGFTHSVPLERALVPEALIAYRMNGAELPDRHGYPARILIPGTYGEINVKWVERMELASSQHEGYYESQGWKAERVHTMSRIDAPAAKSHGVQRGRQTTIRGVAFAGDRGISRVEVSADGGRTWRRAKLDYHRSKVTWALWSTPWKPTRAGTAELVVRATDGSGALQDERKHSSNPSGATGWHRVPVRVV